MIDEGTRDGASVAGSGLHTSAAADAATASDRADRSTVDRPSNPIPQAPGEDGRAPRAGIGVSRERRDPTLSASADTIQTVGDAPNRNIREGAIQ